MKSFLRLPVAMAGQAQALRNALVQQQRKVRDLESQKQSLEEDKRRLQVRLRASACALVSAVKPSAHRRHRLVAVVATQRDSSLDIAEKQHSLRVAASMQHELGVARNDALRTATDLDTARGEQHTLLRGNKLAKEAAEQEVATLQRTTTDLLADKAVLQDKIRALEQDKCQLCTQVRTDRHLLALYALHCCTPCAAYECRLRR